MITFNDCAMKLQKEIKKKERSCLIQLFFTFNTIGFTECELFDNFMSLNRFHKIV